TVNPRAPGFVNDVIQAVKRHIARGLGWFVRDQVEFNRALVGSVDAVLDALNECNRVIAALAQEVAAARNDAGELRDLHSQWVRWRDEWERRLVQAEVQLLRSVAELNAAYDYKLREATAGYERRSAAQEKSFRETAQAQEANVRRELAHAAAEWDKRFWSELDRIRVEYERVIHNELRTLRQRAMAAMPSAPGTAGRPLTAAVQNLGFDYAHFAERFRGTEDDIRERQRMYVPLFAGRANVLDIGCGRGEFLDVMREAGAGAHGIDLDEQAVAYCKAKGHTVECADLFEYLRAQADASLDGIFCAQVIEHLPPERLPEMLRLCGSKLARDGVIALETPNPECLAIFATHFYIDPTHTRPVPPSLAAFYLEEFGFGRIEMRQLAPAADAFPELRELPPAVRERFFGGLDYAITARRL
ncbi:MAG TPA: class I SAM-dependent methyltransferase, partial [Bryobacteraceae bacterium]|nr:class I SAM-dependent methyltransferase [Bryobacteraceae bacterium]